MPKIGCLLAVSTVGRTDNSVHSTGFFPVFQTKSKDSGRSGSVVSKLRSDLVKIYKLSRLTGVIAGAAGFLRFLVEVLERKIDFFFLVNEFKFEALFWLLVNFFKLYALV